MRESTSLKLPSLEKGSSIFDYKVRKYFGFGSDPAPGEPSHRRVESLELSHGDLLSETAEKIKAERNKILRSKNPSLSLSVAGAETEQGPPVKMRRLEAPERRYLLPIMPKARELKAGQSLLLPPRSNTNTIVLPPRPPLGETDHT